MFVLLFFSLNVLISGTFHRINFFFLHSLINLVYITFYIINPYLIISYLIKSEMKVSMKVRHFFKLLTAIYIMWINKVFLKRG